MVTEPRWSVGSVPYVNAAPLIHAFRSPNSPVAVSVDVPSRLPMLLESGKADAILVSSIHALEHPDLQIVDGVGIGSHGPVQSVRLFSKVHFSQIQSLCLDSSSMTSNKLALALLRERYRVAPRTMTGRPDIIEMLEAADACVLIGDIGMTADGAGLQVWDLGEVWTEFTGLPFLWAAWVGRDVPLELAALLARAYEPYSVGKGSDGSVRFEDTGNGAQKELFDFVTEQWGWPRERVADYLLERMVYTLDPRMKRGFLEFGRMLRKHGLLRPGPEPEFVGELASLG